MLHNSKAITTKGKAIATGLADRVLRRMWDTVDTEFEQKLASLPTQTNEFGYDPFGFSPDYVKKAALPLALLYRYYFRVETHGIEKVPAGRVLLIANHSGQIPIDGGMIGCAMILEAQPPRIIRSMAERFVPSLPFVSYFLVRAGQITGTPENCRDMLEREEAIMVFPEGVKGINKSFTKRYQVQEFGQGFMRLALETGAPVVPIAVIGAEEQYPGIYNFKALGKILGFPAFPITPTFPLLPILGLLPYPTKYHIHFGDPLHFEGDPNEDDVEIERKVGVVRSTLQTMIREGLRQRRHIFW